MDATDWFRIRHRDPFSEEVFRTFRASCAVYRARIEAMLEHWNDFPLLRTTPKPTVRFFEPELSDDRRVMSLPLQVDGMTLASRSTLQVTASRELYAYLPFPLVTEVEVGLTEPALTGDGWRNDWWNPNEDNSISGEEAFGRLGYSVHKVPFVRGQSVVIPADTPLGGRLLAILRSWWESRRAV